MISLIWKKNDIKDSLHSYLIIIWKMVEAKLGYQRVRVKRQSQRIGSVIRIMNFTKWKTYISLIQLKHLTDILFYILTQQLGNITGMSPTYKKMSTNVE
jgi:hypothetical protein